MHTSRGRKAKSKPSGVAAISELAHGIESMSRNKPASLSTLNSILQRLQNVFGADAATIYQFEPLHQQLNELASIGGRVELVGFLAIGQGQGLGGWAALHKKPLLLKNRSSNLAFDPDRDYASFLAAPLPLGSAPFGLLAIGCRKPNALTTNNSETLLKLIDPIAVALERFLFCKRLESATREIDRINRQLSDAQAQVTLGKHLSNQATHMVALNHEINEALSVIIGHLQCLAANRTMSNQKELSRLRRMEESALRIRAVNQALLKMARIGQSKQATLAGKA